MFDMAAEMIRPEELKNKQTERKSVRSLDILDLLDLLQKVMGGCVCEILVLSEIWVFYVLVEVFNISYDKNCKKKSLHLMIASGPTHPNDGSLSRISSRVR